MEGLKIKYEILGYENEADTRGSIFYDFFYIGYIDSYSCSLHFYRPITIINKNVDIIKY